MTFPHMGWIRASGHYRESSPKVLSSPLQGTTGSKFEEPSANAFANSDSMGLTIWLAQVVMAVAA